MATDVNSYVSELHGKFYKANYDGRVFSANVTAITLPVIAASLASKFALFNPSGSGVNLELIDFDLGQVLATTVVDTVGIYGQNGPVAAAATFTTLGTVLGGKLVDAASGGQARFYSALTHSGTPTRIALLGTFGAVTNPTDSGIHYEFDGRLIVPPGGLISVAMSTAAGTASGLDVGIRWAEWPI